VILCPRGVFALKGVGHPNAAEAALEVLLVLALNGLRMPIFFSRTPWYRNRTAFKAWFCIETLTLT
jgi:hypothetical protein